MLWISPTCKKVLAGLQNPGSPEISKDQKLWLGKVEFLRDQKLVRHWAEPDGL